jgi:hypothetical protein
MARRGRKRFYRSYRKRAEMVRLEVDELIGNQPDIALINTHLM